MRTYLSPVRVLALCFAVIAYALNGAQTGLAIGSDGTILVPICSPDGTRYVSIDTGDTGDAEIVADCGACLVIAGLRPDEPFQTPVFMAVSPHPARIDIVDPALRSPIWPGAPPIGPPTKQG